jgi:hypothetical protein
MATFVPSTMRWSVEEIKPDARLTKPSVARISRSTSRMLVVRIDREGIYKRSDAALSDVWLMGNALFRLATAALAERDISRQAMK